MKKTSTKKTKTEKTEDSLNQQVRQLLLDVDTTHRYSMSRIYGLYNQVFEKEETPQSCASCLLRKVRELRKWLTAMDAEPGK